MSITNRAIINQKNKDRVREGLCLIRKKTQTNRECKQIEKLIKKNFIVSVLYQ